MSLRSITTTLLLTIGISTQAATPAPLLAEEVSTKAALAVSQLQARAGGKLDYSERSLITIEEILDEASQYKDQLPKRDHDALIHIVGSYVLEVARRSHGGKYVWHDKENQPVLVVGEPKFHVAILTFNKVRGRISGDKADNIVFFYEGFSKRVKSATPGIKVLYG